MVWPSHLLWPSHHSRDPDPDVHCIGGQATGCGRGHTSSIGDQRIASSSLVWLPIRGIGETARRLTHSSQLKADVSGLDTKASQLRADVTGLEYEGIAARDWQ